MCRMKGNAMAEEKSKAEKTTPIQADIKCRDCGALVAVEKKPSTVYCPKCGMSFEIPKSFKG